MISTFAYFQFQFCKRSEFGAYSGPIFIQIYSGRLSYKAAVDKLTHLVAHNLCWRWLVNLNKYVLLTIMSMSMSESVLSGPTNL